MIRRTFFRNTLPGIDYDTRFALMSGLCLTVLCSENKAFSGSRKDRIREVAHNAIFQSHLRQNRRPSFVFRKTTSITCPTNQGCGSIVNTSVNTT